MPPEQTVKARCICRTAAFGIDASIIERLQLGRKAVGLRWDAEWPSVERRTHINAKPRFSVMVPI